MNTAKEIVDQISKAMEGVGKFYRVTEDGKIYSMAHNWRGLGERELTHTLNDDGYPSVRLSIDGKRRHIAVHRLVAHFHLPPRPSPNHEIRHLDGNKLHCRKENLAWGTRSENAIDRQRHGTEMAPANAAKTILSRSGELCATAKLTNADAMDIRRRHSAGEPAHRIAASYPHVSYWTVNNAAKGKTFKEV